VISVSLLNANTEIGAGMHFNGVVGDTGQT